MANVLITYFSASGVTKSIAEKIANENNYDIFEIVPEVIYTPSDLDWTDSNSRSTKEMNDKSFRPPISNLCDVSEYDIVAIGFPVWWYTAPTIINTFIESVDLSGKTIKIFCTSGGSGVDKCVDDLKNYYPNLNFTNGLRLTGRENSNDIKTWIESK